MKISDPVLQNIVSLLESLESLSLKAIYMLKLAFLSNTKG